MFQGLIASRLITPPAVWGKLSGHADFVRSRMRHGESEGWKPWLVQQGNTAQGVRRVVPSAFVLPPGTLSFAHHRFVVGVITPSMDKVGRPHPLLVYHLAHPRWIKLNFGHEDSQAHDWLFWLARTVAKHVYTPGAADIQSLERAVKGIWQPHAPKLRQLWSSKLPSIKEAEIRRQNVQTLLEKNSGPVRADDPAAQLRGVRYFPLADWPQRLYHPRGECTFWQQDAAGAYINVAVRLPILWGGA